MMKRTQRFGFGLTTAERQRLQRLAESEGLSAAATLRLLINRAHRELAPLYRATPRVGQDMGHFSLSERLPQEVTND